MRILYLLITTVVILISLNTKKRILRLNVIYTVLWSLGGFLLTFGLFGLFKPEPRIHYFILISIVVFNLVFELFDNSESRNLDKLTSIRFTTDLVFWTNISSYVLMIPIVYRAIRLIIGNGWFYLRYFAYEGSDVLASDLLLRIYTWIINPIFTATIIITATLIYLKKSTKKMLIISIINILVITISFGGRFNLVRAFVLISSGYLLSRLDKIRTGKIPVKYYLVLISFLIVVIFLTSMRSLSNLSFIQNAYIYVYGSIVYFGEIVNAIPENANYLYGYGTFGYLLNPIVYVFEVLFFDHNITSEYILKVNTDAFIYIGNGIRYNALTTYLYIFFRDGGTIGIILGTAHTIALYLIAKKKSYNETGIFFKGMRIYLIFIILSSTLNYGLLTIQSSMTIIFLFILTRGAKHTLRKVAPNENN